MNFLIRKVWDVPEREHTSESVYWNRRYHRREFLQTLGVAAGGLGLLSLGAGCSRPSEEELQKAGAVKPLPKEFAELYPAERDERFEYGRPETAQKEVLEFTNFYEFSGSKSSWQYVDQFEPRPWTLTVDGLCASPGTFDLDAIYQAFSLEERAYRHRCVETWAMCIPWTGFPLHRLLKKVEPEAKAKYVLFETFNRPEQAPNMQHSQYPWPYTEGLTLEEAGNELTLLTTGVYGAPLAKQNGAPIRLVVPWKYGFKSIKSIVRITLTDKRPKTFWNTMMPDEYGFEANVNPDVAHPRWSQQTEWMLGTREEYPTQIYNGYGEFVGGIYRG